MSSPRKSFQAIELARGGRRSPGFTLLEVALALLLVALACWLGLLLVGRGVRHGRTDRFMADLQGFAAAFQDYRRQKGGWPPSTTPDVSIPHGMENILQETNWSGGSPFGGHYGWIEPGPPRPPGARRDQDNRGRITLTAFSPDFPVELTRSDLLELDRRIDDGDLATGRFRTGFNGWPVYLVGDSP